jgi:hypothetical protein
VPGSLILHFALRSLRPSQGWKISPLIFNYAITQLPNSPAGDRSVYRNKNRILVTISITASSSRIVPTLTPRCLISLQ